MLRLVPITTVNKLIQATQTYLAPVAHLSETNLFLKIEILLVSGTNRASTLWRRQKREFPNWPSDVASKGDFLHGIGQGNYETRETHILHSRRFQVALDGCRIGYQGNISLAGERSWEAKIFELS
jgi:hypothetical protein